VRTAPGGQVLCEPCFATWQSYQQPFVPVNPGSPNPAAAAVLGLIPGVGAMYNGQFFKGLIHVVIFAVLVSMAHISGIFGIFIPAWIIYQSFEAFHTRVSLRFNRAQALAPRNRIPAPGPPVRFRRHRPLAPGNRLTPEVPTRLPIRPLTRPPMRRQLPALSTRTRRRNLFRLTRPRTGIRASGVAELRLALSSSSPWARSSCSDSSTSSTDGFSNLPGRWP
jgi:TM2 domain-containing membrane protein YozV